MKHYIFVDEGGGHAALLAAAMWCGKLPCDRLPTEDELQSLFSRYYRPDPPGTMHVLMGEPHVVCWCGLGKSLEIVLRAWRNFLHLYERPQADVKFLPVPSLPLSHKEWATRHLYRMVKKNFQRLQTILLCFCEEG